MRKKLAVILAATLALQSFTVPAFAGEQYDEVVEVIEDAEGLEAAEDISDDEDIDINYGDDTAETFDETAVDVAEASAEWSDESLDAGSEEVEYAAEDLADDTGETTTTTKCLVSNLTTDVFNEFNGLPTPYKVTDGTDQFGHYYAQGGTNYYDKIFLE